MDGRRILPDDTSPVNILLPVLSSIGYDSYFLRQKLYRNRKNALFLQSFRNKKTMMTFDFYPETCILTGICCILFIIQLIYIFSIYNKIHKRCKNPLKDISEELPPLSVLIVTKDSGNALKENLPVILEQDYPEFEVIVVNDKSAGEDENILKLLEQKYKNLYHTFIPETARYVSRKKLGIAMGIRASRNEWLVVTEPNCRPVSNQWLRSLARQMTPHTDIVLGYSNFMPKKGWFAKTLVLDMFFLSVRYLGRAIAGSPYMGIGRNLAYRKSTYQKHKGFSDHLQLQRGEDDLFINAVANERNTRVAIEPDSIVRMPVPPYKRIWLEEKIGRMVTGHYYQGTARLLNSIETWTCGLFHLASLAGIITSIYTQQWIFAGIILLLWLIRFICEMTVFHHTAKDLQENMCCIFPWFDLVRPLWSLKRQIQYIFHSKTDYMRK